jgi:hypothetical protein
MTGHRPTRLTRRTFLQQAAVGVAGTTLAHAANPTIAKEPSKAKRTFGKAKSVVVLYLYGGRRSYF